MLLLPCLPGAIRGTEAFLIVPSKLAKQTFGMLLSFRLFIFIFHNLFNENFICFKICWGYFQIQNIKITNVNMVLGGVLSWRNHCKPETSIIIMFQGIMSHRWHFYMLGKNASQKYLLFKIVWELHIFHSLYLQTSVSPSKIDNLFFIAVS